MLGGNPAMNYTILSREGVEIILLVVSCYRNSWHDRALGLLMQTLTLLEIYIFIYNSFRK